MTYGWMVQGCRRRLARAAIISTLIYEDVFEATKAALAVHRQLALAVTVVALR